MRLDVPPSVRELISDPRQALWITEGSKKADAAVSHGLTCIALMGVWNWRGKNANGGATEIADWDAIALKGRAVYIAFDSDVMQKSEVQMALRRLSEMLTRRGADVRFVIIPFTGGAKVGLDDFFVGGGTITELIAASVDKLPFIPRDFGDKQFALTDLGNAERMVAAFGQDLRYCHQWKRWLVWDGRRWEGDMNGGASVRQMAYDVVRSIYTEAEKETDTDARKAIAGHAVKSESARMIGSMLDLTTAMPGVPCTPEGLDQHTAVINFANGALDLITFEMRDHRRDDLITQVIDIPYDATADCPRWIAFMEEIFQGDVELLRYVTKAVGYALTGETQEKAFFYLHGPGGNNGKSVFVETIARVLGDYAATTPSSSFVNRKDGEIPADLARLKEKRFVTASEIGEGKRLEEELIKQITGGDKIAARHMFSHLFEFTPQFKVWMTGNYTPTIRGTDEAIWSRVKLIPFNYTVPKERRDLNLREKLWEERAGILAWMVDGCMAYRKEGLGSPPAVANAVSEYRDGEDTLGDFVRVMTIVSSGDSVTGLKLYEAYERWAKTNGMKPMTNAMFGRRMKARGVRCERTRTGMVYLDVAILDNEDYSQVYRGTNDD
jgi:putative DNA primase/helicase